MLAQNLYEINNRAGLSGVTSDPGELISKVIPYIFYAAGLGLLVYLISGGLGLMLSKGDPKAVQSAQAKITTAVVGFVIIFVSYWVVRLIGQMFGITVFTEIFGSATGPGR